MSGAGRELPGHLARRRGFGPGSHPVTPVPPGNVIVAALGIPCHVSVDLRDHCAPFQLTADRATTRQQQSSPNVGQAGLVGQRAGCRRDRRHRRRQDDSCADACRRTRSCRPDRRESRQRSSMPTTCPRRGQPFGVAATEADMDGARPDPTTQPDSVSSCAREERRSGRVDHRRGAELASCGARPPACLTDAIPAGMGWQVWLVAQTELADARRRGLRGPSPTDSRHVPSRPDGSWRTGTYIGHRPARWAGTAARASSPALSTRSSAGRVPRRIHQRVTAS